MSSVISYLSKALNNQGHDIRIFIPKFGSIDEKKYPLEVVYKGLKVPTGYKKEDSKPTHLICNIKKYSDESGVTYYFLENMEYYEKRSNVYGYSDDHIRWSLLSYGAIQYVCNHLDWSPDVVHSHDWHTGLVPNIIKTKYAKSPCFENTVCIHTIHNIAFQGLSIDPTSQLNFDDGKSVVPRFYSDRLRTLNFLRRGILYADLVNTVSEGYARQILTPEYGCGLDKLLLELRSKLFGIINGIDTEKFNPKIDPLLPNNYDINSLDRRLLNKAKLQKEFGLENDPEALIFGFVGRLEHMKGVDLMIEVVEKILKRF